MSTRTYRLLLLAAYLIGVAVLLLQPLRFVFSDAFTGLLPYRGMDESLYLIRLQEALLSGTADVTAGIWGGAHTTTGMQMAFMERVVGWFFGWTGLDATWVALIITALAAPSVLPLTSALLKRAGSSRMQAVVLSVLFFILMGYFRRFFNPSWSMPLLLAALLLLWRWWDYLQLKDAVGAGVILGILAGVYFWAWTFSWAVFGLLFVCVLDARKHPDFHRRLKQFLLIAVVMLIAAAPFLWRMYVVSHHPLFPESSLRMGLIYAREFESLPRSFLIALLTGGTLWAFHAPEERFRMSPLMAIVVAALVVMHQQFLHGRIMSFSSHYYMYVCLAALLASAAAVVRWKWEPGRMMIIASSLVLFGGAYHDYDVRLNTLRAVPEALIPFDHLVPALDNLKDGNIDTVLTDGETANIVASITEDHVAYTDYSKILLVSTRERAERYCLSEIFGKEPVDTTFLAQFDDERSRAGRAQAAWLYDRHVQITKDACAWVSEDIPRALRKYEVTKVLWNMHQKPQWDIERPYLRRLAEGEGWKLYQFVDEPVPLASSPSSVSSSATSSTIVTTYPSGNS